MAKRKSSSASSGHSTAPLNVHGARIQGPLAHPPPASPTSAITTTATMATGINATRSHWKGSGGVERHADAAGADEPQHRGLARTLMSQRNSTIDQNAGFCGQKP